MTDTPKRTGFCFATLKLGRKGPSYHKIAYGWYLSSQPISSGSSLGTSLIHDHWVPHLSPKTMTGTPKMMIFLCHHKIGWKGDIPSYNFIRIVFSFQPASRGSNNISLIYAYGGPLLQPLNSDRCPQKDWIFLWHIKVGIGYKFPYHKISYGMSLSSQPIYPGSRPPIYDYWRPHHSLKTTDTLEITLMVTIQNSVILGVSVIKLGL